MNIIALYDKLEKLAARLPTSCHRPILRELGPSGPSFCTQRAPRLLLLGDRAASRSELVNALFGEDVADLGEDHLQDGTWQLFASPVANSACSTAAARSAPSTVRVRSRWSLRMFAFSSTPASAPTAELDEDVLRARGIYQSSLGSSAPPVIGVACGMSSEILARGSGEHAEHGARRGQSLPRPHARLVRASRSAKRKSIGSPPPSPPSCPMRQSSKWRGSPA